MSGPENPLNLPDIPGTLKSIQPYLKIACNHDVRDPVVSYWCRLYALQTGLKLSTKTPEETTFLLKLMDWLESTKRANQENDAITNDIAAQAHLENWALKLFLYADKNDRESNFNKNVVLSFYTAGLLYDVLTTFGELSEEAIQNRKYSKWKATYINNCLKNGETPVPGPAKEDDDDSNAGGSLDGNEDNEANEYNEYSDHNVPPQQPGPSIMPTMPSYPMQPLLPSQPTSAPTGNLGPFDFPSVPDETHDEGDQNIENPEPFNPTPAPVPTPASSSISLDDKLTSLKLDGASLSLEQTAKAQKYIKWAGSALNYDDVPTAISNLQKALHLLSTGQDPV